MSEGPYRPPARLPRDHPLLPRCFECRGELRNGARYCSHCGAPQLAGLKRPAEEPAASQHRAAVTGAAGGPRLPAKRRRRKKRRVRITPALKGVFGFFAAMLGVIVFFSLLGQMSAEPSAFLEVAFALGFAILVLAVVIPSNTVTRRSFRFNVKQHVPVIALAFAGMAVFMVVYFAVLTPLISQIEGAETNFTQYYLDAGFSILAILVLLAVFPAIFEELAFRGYIQTRLMRALSVHEALIIQAVLFSLLHLSLLILISHTVMGLVFGWLRYETKSLTPAILLHFLWNASVVFVELTWM